ncbi:hypothetical protein [Endozoicomonas sp. ONNA1]|uniref:hypothetical protein n=1 Tax=Endozoicomonas sp. ONNA1 TaxID=2828740 RepID=UPI002149451A|nr:hypothetical protein [Endozoicomonas sp. ONNA1]
MRNSFFVALLLLPESLSIICQAEPLTRRAVVEFQDNNLGSITQSFSTKCDMNTLSLKSTDIADTNDHAESDLPPDANPHGPGGYELKTTLIEFISCQSLYATSLLVAYELVLNTNAASGFKPYSWLPTDVCVAAGWLLKSYWNRDSPLSGSMEQSEASQCDLFTITIMMLPGNSQRQNEPSESSGQNALRASAIQLSGSIISALSSGSGGGKENPEQHRHTLRLNCFVDSCHGVCRFRPSGIREPADGSLSSGKSSTLRSMNAGAANGAHTSEFVCDVVLITENGKRMPCGAAFRDDERLFGHKMRDHTGAQFCDALVGGGDGEERLCGWIFSNIPGLWRHRRRCHRDGCDIRRSHHRRKYHTEPRICDVIVFSDGGAHLCGRIFSNSEGLGSHRRRCHQDGHRIRWNDRRR